MRTLFLIAFAATAAYAQSGFDVVSLNRAADPCVNFYQFACGGWMTANPIPGDQARWGRFDALQDRNRTLLQNMLETASSNKPGRSAIAQKIGDYYAACMDEAVLNSRSMDTLQRDLNRIAVVNDKRELPDLLVMLYRLGSASFFHFSSEQDAKQAGQMIAGFDQGGLGLPDRDYYFKTDEKSVEIRTQYRVHLERIFGLLGQQPAQAKQSADAVMRIETALADGSLDRVARRDPDNIYHKMTVEELRKLAPAFDWNAYFSGLGAPKFTSLNIAVPKFAEAFSKIIADQPLADIKSYVTWHLVNDNAVMLNTALRQASFDFFEKTLRGTKEMRPRWKICVDLTDSQLPDALGKEFISKTLGAEGIRRMDVMVKALEIALERDIMSLDWMTAETKKRAIEKLHKIANKVGNQAKWKDYANVRIARDDAYGNAARASQDEIAFELAKIGKKVDKTEWHMSQPTVNAYYDPQNNDINFPAGILQPPFYNNSADDAINYGAIGAVIGHELTHGFDDEGRQFDADGNLRDWWTEADAKAFEQRANCLIDEYASFSPIPGVNLNGKLTLGENTADNGGLRIAYMAFEESLKAARAAGKVQDKIDGFTPEQRIFLGWAQVWCQNSTDEMLRMRAQTDPHAAAQFRVNGVVSNMPEFAKAFACQAGQPMVRGNACRVW
jgi:endothelin-converting enzyme/putative endopeptidase